MTIQIYGLVTKVERQTSSKTGKDFAKFIVQASNHTHEILVFDLVLAKSIAQDLKTKKLNERFVNFLGSVASKGGFVATGFSEKPEEPKASSVSDNRSGKLPVHKMPIAARDAYDEMMWKKGLKKEYIPMPSGAPGRAYKWVPHGEEV